MGSLSEISLGDITTAAARYRPVAVSVAAVLVALAVLPEPKFKDSPLASAPTFDSADASFGDRKADTEDVAAQPLGDAPPVTVEPNVTFDSDFSTEFAAGGDAFSNGAEGSDSARGFGATTSDPTVEPSAPAPLTVVRYGWWSRTPSTAVTGAVPKGALPVGKRFGQDDKRSFIELAGEASVLSLKESSEGRRASLGAPALAICPITAEWEDAEGMAASPPYDATSCVAGSYGDGGLWTFDMSKFGDAASWEGFAIVPAPGSPVDFHVNLLPA